MNRALRPVNIFFGLLLLFLVVLPFIGATDAQLQAEEVNGVEAGWGWLIHSTHGRLMEIALLILIYIILALGLNVVVGFTGLLDLGFVAFMTIGAYTAVLLYRVPEWHFAGSFFIVLLLSGLHCALWGAIRGAPTLHLTGDYYAIVTLAIAEIVFFFALNESWLTGGPSGIKGYPPVTLSYSDGEDVRVRIKAIVTLDDDNQPVIAWQFTPKEVWLGQPGPNASDRIVKRYNRKKPDPERTGTRLKLRNFDPHMGFIHFETDQPWLVTGSGVVDGESPGSLALMAPHEREPGQFRKPLLWVGKDHLAPGEYEADVTLAHSFGRSVLRDGTRGFYYLIFGLACVTYVIMALLKRSRLGRAWMAIKTDELSAQSCGINIKRKKMIAFAISGFFGGIGGALMGFKFLIVSTNTFEFWMSIVVLCCVVLGGMGSIRGVVIGAILFIGLGELLRQPILFSDVSEASRAWVQGSTGFVSQVLSVNSEGIELNLSRTRYLVFGLLLVLVMIFCPAGIFPPNGRGAVIAKDARTRLRDQFSRLFHLKGAERE